MSKSEWLGGIVKLGLSVLVLKYLYQWYLKYPSQNKGEESGQSSSKRKGDSQNSQQIEGQGDDTTGEPNNITGNEEQQDRAARESALLRRHGIINDESPRTRRRTDSIQRDQQNQKLASGTRDVASGSGGGYSKDSVNDVVTEQYGDRVGSYNGSGPQPVGSYNGYQNGNMMVGNSSSSSSGAEPSAVYNQNHHDYTRTASGTGSMLSSGTGNDVVRTRQFLTCTGESDGDSTGDGNHNRDVNGMNSSGWMVEANGNPPNSTKSLSDLLRPPDVRTIKDALFSTLWSPGSEKQRSCYSSPAKKANSQRGTPGTQGGNCNSQRTPGGPPSPSSRPGSNLTPNGRGYAPKGGMNGTTPNRHGMNEVPNGLHPTGNGQQPDLFFNLLNVYQNVR